MDRTSDNITLDCYPISHLTQQNHLLLANTMTNLCKRRIAYEVSSLLRTLFRFADDGWFGYRGIGESVGIPVVSICYRKFLKGTGI